MPSDYAAALNQIKSRIQEGRLRTVMAANSAMILLYSGWGARVIDRLSCDLRDSFPDMKGFSPRNLKYIRAFAVAWPDRAIVQQLAAQIPWFWYVEQATRHGWSRSILALPPCDSDMAAQVFKDPYLFDFLGTADPLREREVEGALVDHVQRFLLELGTGFAFVGRQVHLEVGDQDFYVDLLLYHLKLRCYVTVELKAVRFNPSFLGKLNLCLSAVDDLLRHPDDKPTIGLLLCRSKDRIVVEYALRGLERPIGVAEWETKIVESLPEALKGSLPTVEEIERELRRP